MVKTPRARHSSRKKEPVTIELGPDQVSRLSESPGAAGQDADGPEPAVSRPPEEAGATAEGDATETATSMEDADARQEADDAGYSRPGAGAYYSVHEEASPADGAAPLPRPAARDGFGRSLAAGLAGGVIALLLAGGLQWADLIPALGKAGGDEAALRSLRSDVDALEQKTASFDAGTVDAATIKQALAPVEKHVGELAAGVDQAKSDAAAARSAAAAGGSAGSAELKDIRDRLAKLEHAFASASKAAPSAETVDALGRKVDMLGQTTVDNSDALKRLEDRVTALGGKLAERAGEPNAAAAIAASALKSAIERGGSFAAELDTFAAVAPNTPELAELRALASKGVPTRAELATDVGAVADRMLDATRRTSDSDTGVVGRLMASARSLVKVRPVGKVEGDGVEARIARFRNAIAGGDLAGAAAGYDALPEKAKAAGVDFMAGVRARLKVDALAQKVLADALKTG